MEITFERVCGQGIQIVRRNDEKFYNLADIMDASEVKPSWKVGLEKRPINISGRIVWGLRMVGSNYIESIFVDHQCMMNIFAEYPIKTC